MAFDDIFSRKTDSFGGAFSADAATITFPKAFGAAGADPGLLVQQMRADYRQQVTRLYELGSPRIYYVGGRTDGTATVQRIVGPRNIAAAFYERYGDVCNAKNNVIDVRMSMGCGDTVLGGSGYQAKYVVITQVGLSMTAENMLISENLQMMFSAFRYTGA